MDLFPEHKSKLIKDTTREEREEIVRRGLGTCGKRTGEVYRPYIEGEKELHEINAEHR